MNKDINKTHRGALFYLYNINYYLTSESAAALLHTFVIGFITPHRLLCIVIIIVIVNVLWVPIGLVR